MLNDDSIRKKICSMIQEVTENEYKITTKDQESEALYYIISESIRATNFVILLEDEFDIEFDDDELDMDFFSGIDRIIQLINKQLNRIKT